MDLTAGILLFAIGVPVTVFALYGLISWLDIPRKNKRYTMKDDDCQ